MTDIREPNVIDTSDLDRYVGTWVGGGSLNDPISASDIRRRVQAMQYPNPLHYVDEYAATSTFGRIVAPQSFLVCCDVGHGAAGAIVGNIPGSHVLFGGDEWWFDGGAVFPGDRIHTKHRFADYRIVDTKFAGPAVFARGDTVYFNDRGNRLARQRLTAIRYLAEEASRRGLFEASAAAPPVWSAAQLDDLDRRKSAWIASRAGAAAPLTSTSACDAQLPTRPIGPHSIESFTTEWRSMLITVWGAVTRDGEDHTRGAGWTAEMAHVDGGAEDPSLDDGINRGPSSSHVDAGLARGIGMPRAYGYSASVGSWALDYVAFWAGDAAVIRHAAFEYRFPPFEGDVAYVTGQLVARGFDPMLGIDQVTVELLMTNQDDKVLCKGSVVVQVPE